MKPQSNLKNHDNYNLVESYKYTKMFILGVWYII